MGDRDFEHTVLVTGAGSGIGRAAVDLYRERGWRVVALDLTDAGLRDAITHFDRILSVNLRGTALGIRAALPAFRAAGGGSVVVTSSVAGLRGDPTTWAYNATKAGLINLVRALAVDYAHENIRINTVAPGFTRTGLTAGAWRDEASSASLISRVPMLRWSEPREQAEVIWFLTSPAASYITGAVFVADGGVSASNGFLDPPGR
jgi:meso-butanediol dehydrogenase/(S,S)-butanediol dehydrogenase/diacetyl reductase